MAKLTLTNLSSLQNEQSAINTINANNDAIEAAVEKTLSRDGTVPNQMTSELDMNSQRVLNLPQPLTDNEPVRLIDLTEVVEGTGNGNILGPVSAVSGNYPMFTGTSGKVVADSGTSPATKADVASPTISNPTFTGTTTVSGAVNGADTVTLTKNGGGTWPLILSNNSAGTADLIKLLAPGITSGNKYVRVDSLGNFQVINNAYTSAALTLSDGGNLTVPGSATFNMAGDTVKGRLSTSGAASDLSKTQLTSLINPVTSSLSGAAPASGGGTTNYLRADSTWAIPPGPVLLNTLVASGVSSSLQDTSSLTSTYSRYIIEVINLRSSSGDTTLTLQVHSGGTFQTTNYVAAINYFSGSASAAQNSTTYHFISPPSVSNTGVGLTGSYEITNPSDTSTYKPIRGSFTTSNSGFSSAFGGNTAGFWTNTAAVTGFRIQALAGNLTGTVKIYGII